VTFTPEAFQRLARSREAYPGSGSPTSAEALVHFGARPFHRHMRSVAIRFVVSAAIVLASSAPYLLQRDVLSAAAAPWLWFHGLNIQVFQPTSPFVLFLSTGVLLAVGATARPASIAITVWCLLNVALAWVMNFRLYPR